MSSKLSAEQLAYLRKKLEAKRDELRRKSQAYLETAEAPGDESERSEVGDLAEREQEIGGAVSLAEHEQAELEEVLHALEKFDRGTYGVSEKTGLPIPYARLDAVPWARSGTSD